MKYFDLNRLGLIKFCQIQGKIPTETVFLAGLPKSWELCKLQYGQPEGKSPKWVCVMARDAGKLQGPPVEVSLDMLQTEMSLDLSQLGNSLKLLELVTGYGDSVSSKLRKFPQWIITKITVRFLLSKHSY